MSDSFVQPSLRAAEETNWLFVELLQLRLDLKLMVVVSTRRRKEENSVRSAAAESQAAQHDPLFWHQERRQMFLLYQHLTEEHLVALNQRRLLVIQDEA